MELMHEKPVFRIGSLVVSAAVLAFAAGLRISLAEDSARLAGKWNFNQDHSDNAGQKVHDAETSARMQTSGYPGAGGSQGGGYPNGGTYPNGTDYPGGGYPGAGGAGMPGGRGGMGPMGRIGRGQRGPTAQGAGLSGEDMEQLAADRKILTVEQEEKQVTISDDDGQTTILYPDGKKHKGKDSSGPLTNIKAHWEGNRLVSEGKLGHAGKLTETYELSPDGKELYLVQRLDNSQLSAPLVIRRVYDAAVGTK